MFHNDKDGMEARGQDKPMNQKAIGPTPEDFQIRPGPKDGAGRVIRRGARLQGAFEPLPGDSRRSRAVDPRGRAGGREGGRPVPRRRHAVAAITRGTARRGQTNNWRWGFRAHSARGAPTSVRFSADHPCTKSLIFIARRTIRTIRMVGAGSSP